MIVRIVQMTFKNEHVSAFLELFDERKAIIRSHKGCSHLELWRDNKRDNVFFTYSIWETESDLDNYRFSEFFKDTWGKTKALFSEKPQAWSVVKMA